MEGSKLLWVQARDNIELALHYWPANRPKAVVFYIHGIQSHAGWLFETGPFLANKNIAVFALDRRGSGLSGGVRGHFDSPDIIISDYLSAMATVRSIAPRLPFTVLGQSFGGSILAGLCIQGDFEADKVIFCAPALSQQRARHSPTKLQALRQMRGTAKAPLMLNDIDYTEGTAYLKYMAGDQLMLREITNGARAAMVALEDIYVDARFSLNTPVFLAVPERDPIIDLHAARNQLDKMGVLVEERIFAGTQHYLEFGPSRQSYLEWVANCAIISCQRCGGNNEHSTSA